MRRDVAVFREEATKADNSPHAAGQSLLCEPSQSGPLSVALHPQKKTVLSASASYFIGENPLSLCEPSQKGCLEDWPQVHQKYDLPAITSTG
jgi:hypothetical protein